MPPKTLNLKPNLGKKLTPLLQINMKTRLKLKKILNLIILKETKSHWISHF